MIKIMSTRFANGYPGQVKIVIKIVMKIMHEHHVGERLRLWLSGQGRNNHLDGLSCVPNGALTARTVFPTEP